jgi:hypothetical protein
MLTYFKRHFIMPMYIAIPLHNVLPVIASPLRGVAISLIMKLYKIASSASGLLAMTNRTLCKVLIAYTSKGK